MLEKRVGEEICKGVVRGVVGKSFVGKCFRELLA